MRLLILGGTLFLGRHLVLAALARGHDVTVFTRGKRPNPFGTRVTHLVGERDPRVGPGLAALGDRAWDAVVDTSGYVPRVVAASVGLLRERAPHYAFVSSISVYADASVPGQDEGAPLAPLPDSSSEAVMEHYGALKAACEAVVRAAYGERALVVRPGLIVGPCDPSDRFAYWVARFRLPHLLGERGPEAVVPAPPERPVQLIDARDLAAWLLDLVERGTAGTFDACSRAGAWTFGDLVDALCAVAPAARPAWIDDAVLLRHGVVPWTGLPLWLPASDPEHAGFMLFSCERAYAAGLRCRPLADTIADTAAWLRERPAEGTFRSVLTAATERAILADRG